MMNPERYINAAKDGYLDVLQQATKRDLNWPDEDGLTAVTWAARNGHLDALRLIVGRGGEANRSDYLGLTPLHHAAQRGYLHVVTYLVNWGVNIHLLDNDHHSAMDLASLHEKVEVVRYLDEVCGQQTRKNPKSVNRAKEDAIKQAERNIKRYEKLQDEASRRLQKEQRKFQTSARREGGENGQVQTSAQSKNNFLKTITWAIRGNRTPRKTVAPSGQRYSDIAGMTAGRQGGAARRIQQRKKSAGDVIEADRADDFKISDVDEKGKRTLRSLSGVQGVRSGSSEVMYLTGQRGGGGRGANNSVAMSDIGTSRPALYEVFDGHPPRTPHQLYKAKSESDLLDSGVDSYIGDEDYDDGEENPGIFNRPGFGKTAFLTGNKFLNTLQSFDGQLEDDDAKESTAEAGEGEEVVNGVTSQMNGGGDADDENDDDATASKLLMARGPKEVPWANDEEEDVDRLDDEEDGTKASTIETFLWSAQLEPYLHVFLKEQVDLQLLVNMSEADLEKLGLPFGPRKRLLDVINRRQSVLSVPKRMMDSCL